MNPTLDLYVASTAYGLCADVDPRSIDATALMFALEPALSDCSMPDCDEAAIRVAVFECLNRKSDKKWGSEFRGLCERHKQIGMWSNAEKAFGWD